LPQVALPRQWHYVINGFSATDSTEQSTRFPADRRRTEAELTQDFVTAHPRILGALLDAVSAALRNVDDVVLNKKPGMADTPPQNVLPLC